MKRIKRIIAVTAALVMTLAVGAAFVGCGPKEKTIAVIAKGETHAFWQAVKSGAEDAGKKYGYKITFRGPANEKPDSVPAQKEMVSSALALKPVGMALATIGAGFGSQLEEAFAAGIPVVEFDSGIHTKEDINKDKNPIVASVATSNKLAAGMAATEMFKAIKADIVAATAAEKYKVGIIQHDGSQTGLDRAAGFKETLEAAVAADTTTAGKLEIINKGASEEGKYVDAGTTLKTSGVKAIFMCNEGVVKEIYAKVTTDKDFFKGIKFIGYDAGTAQINWMKGGPEVGSDLIGSVAQNSVQIGYQAVEQVVFAIEKKTVTKKVELAGAWWNKANVDDMIAKNLVYTD